MKNKSMFHSSEYICINLQHVLHHVLYIKDKIKIIIFNKLIWDLKNLAKFCQIKST